MDHITESVVKNANLILLLFDCSSNSTWNELFRELDFYDLINPCFSVNQPILLLANKTDLLDKRFTDTIPFNKTFLHNVSTVPEDMIRALQLFWDTKELETQPAPNPKDSVSLKVYR